MAQVPFDSFVAGYALTRDGGSPHNCIIDVGKSRETPSVCDVSKEIRNGAAPDLVTMADSPSPAC